MKSKLADFNFFYSLFLPAVGFGVRCHYRSITIRGRENVPWGEHFIIAPCHQNALMDPLLVLQFTRRKTVFLARADIFQNPVARFFLTWLRISPVYRIRDGRDQLSRNEEIFSNSRQVLEKNVPLCLMAEGTHNHLHQLLPLVKGMFRIAGATQLELGDKPLYILPVGLDYDDYEALGQSVCVNIGKPIDVRQYMDEYRDHEPVALNHMRADLTAALKGQIHEVFAREQYDDEYAYCHLMTQETLRAQHLRNTPWNRFLVRKQLSDQMPALSDEQRAQCYADGAAYARECRRRGLPLWFASKGWTCGKSLLAAAALLAFAALMAFVPHLLKYYLLSNLVVFLPTHLFPKYKIKDPQFRSSVNYGIRLVLHLLYLIAILIVFACTRGLLFGIVMLLLGMVSAYITPRLFFLLRDIYYSLK